MKDLPKSLWKFYFKYATKGFWGLLIAWALMSAWDASSIIWHPLTQRWFIALFERPIDNWKTFLIASLPTVLVIMLIHMSFSTSLMLRSVFEFRWRPKIKKQISEVLTEYTQNQSMSFWKERMAGSVNQKMNYIVNGFEIVATNSYRIIMQVIMMAASVGLLMAINRWIALVFGIVFVFRLVYSILLVGPLGRASAAVGDAQSVVNGKLIDSLTNFSIVKLFTGARREREYLHEPRVKSVKAQMHLAFMQRLFWGIPNYVWDLSYVAILIFCIVLYAKGEMLISEVVFATSVFFNVMEAIGGIIYSIPLIVDAQAMAKKSYKDLIVPIEITDKENAPDLVIKKGKVEFKNVWFKYKNKYVFRGLNLVLKGGEKVGLVGFSGAGKTTLANLFMRLYDTIKGEILIDGQNIRDVTQDSLRENIAVIPQEAILFNRTLKENIAYGKPGATDKEIQKAAKSANAHEFIMETEKKYDSLVGERGIKLSGGQRQRIAIARAFLKNAPILVLDEATSALDSETEISIQRAFEELSKGRTTIAIAHRLSTLRNMDRIIVLNKGKIIEQGTHIELLRKGGEYARLWKMQSGGFIPEMMA